MRELVSPLPRGFVLEEYQIERVLGQGGFGTTYLCLDRNLERKCVVKEFTPHHFVRRRRDNAITPKSLLVARQFRESVSSFGQEARRLAMFNHPNIVKVLRFFEGNGTACIVMC